MMGPEDHEDMHANLLQELLEKLMEMKDGGGDDKKPSDPLSALADQGDDEDDSDPKAKLAMLEVKPGGEGHPAMADEAADHADQEDDMGKALGEADFQKMRMKHLMGG